MEKPSSLKRIGNTDKYQIKGLNDTKETFESTPALDGNHLIIISGTGLDAWDIRKHFNKKDKQPIAIAVLDKKDELVGIALGNGDTGTNSIIPLLSKGSVTITGILDNDDRVRSLSDVIERKIAVERTNGKVQINKKDADDLSALVIVGRKLQSRKEISEDKIIPPDKVIPPAEEGILKDPMQKIFQRTLGQQGIEASIKDHANSPLTPLVAMDKSNNKNPSV